MNREQNKFAAYRLRRKHSEAQEIEEIAKECIALLWRAVRGEFRESSAECSTANEEEV